MELWDIVKPLDLKELAIGLLAILLRALSGSDFPDLEETGDVSGEDDTDDEGLGVSTFLIQG